MQKVILVFVAAVVCCRAASVSRHINLLPEIGNNIEPSALSTSRHRKFVAIARRPNSVYLHPSDSTLEITCEALGTPAPNIRWFKNMAPVYEHDLESNEIIDTNPSSLARVKSTLLVPKTEDKDEYTCVASSGFKTARASTTVYSVADGSTDLNEHTKLTHLLPHILVYYKVFVDVIENDVILPCKVRGYPRPRVTWTDNKGNEVTTDNKRMKVLRSGELIISQLSWSDMGEFSCRAENSFGSKNATTFVYPAKAG